MPLFRPVPVTSAITGAAYLLHRWRVVSTGGALLVALALFVLCLLWKAKTVVREMNETLQGIEETGQLPLTRSESEVYSGERATQLRNAPQS
jgi:flagellar biogenesis protein FliO